MTRLAIMLSFISAWKAKDIDGVLAHFAEDIVWHYAAAVAPPVRGKDKARKLLQALAPQVGEVRWRIFDAVEEGDRLFVEGVDEYVSAEGRLVSAPYAGVAEFRGELITGLREYFDIGVVSAMKAGGDAPPHVRALIDRASL
jgi:limonene-1,2-epoxide hydrolase